MVKLKQLMNLKKNFIIIITKTVSKITVIIITKIMAIIITKIMDTKNITKMKHS